MLLWSLAVFLFSIAPTRVVLSRCFPLLAISYSTLYATTTPTTLDPWSIGSWHIGHGIDAAATPKSHSTHTARWLHGKDTSKTQKVLLLVIYTLQLLLVVGKSQKIVPAS